jgi:hypothetical protein
LILAQWRARFKAELKFIGKTAKKVLRKGFAETMISGFRKQENGILSAAVARRIQTINSVKISREKDGK